MNIRKPGALVHIGAPDRELPHESMERCEKFHKENPEMMLYIVVWDKAELERLTPKIDAEKCRLVLWNDDDKLLSWLMDQLLGLVGAQIVSSRWYLCDEGHTSQGTYQNLVEECVTCKRPVKIVEPFKEKVQEFCLLFQKVIHLANFDTTSGVYLTSLVSPTRNVMFNMPYAIESQFHKPLECKDLMGVGKGKKAIICGAGPSLEDALPHIKRVQDSHIIICVGRAYKMMRSYGIRVDYTQSVEMFDWDSSIFDDVGDVGETVLAFAAVCAPTTVRKWPGKKVCLWDIESAMVAKQDHFILGGNSVSHHMLNFAAQILECDEIIMAGIDLAYTKPKTHAEGTSPASWPTEITAMDAAYQTEAWVPCTGKGDQFHPECHRGTAAMGANVNVSNLEVRSSPSYRNFATLFTILISKHGKKVYNACPNGQKIIGTEFLDLKSYLTATE